MTDRPIIFSAPMVRVLWNDLHGEDAWERNPWVCALTFTVHRQNIDQLNKGATK